MARRDLYQEVTDRILEALEEGTAPWVKPWDSGFGLPRNGVSGRPYSGVNVLLCWIAGYGSQEWFTFNQAKKLGGHVRRGESATTLVFFKMITIEEDDEEKRIPLLRHFNVFNREQIEGLPDPESDADPVPVPSYLNDLIEDHRMNVTWGGPRACWSRVTDEIRMPKMESFVDEGAAAATLLHEMIHWTGPRLDRDMNGRFGDEAYAMEELVAEMGSAFACAELGVAGTLQHPEYIANWIRVLRGDKKAVFGASSAAREAHEYLKGADDA